MTKAQAVGAVSREAKEWYAIDWQSVFFFQAEDGIRDVAVTGVQTCALPILFALSPHAQGLAQDMYQALWSCVTCVVVTVLVTLVTKPRPDEELKGLVYALTEEIGRASCRERV